MLQHAINWFEIPVSDFERAKRFYSAIFDYEMPEFPMGENIRMGILLYNQESGGIGGAICQGEWYKSTGDGIKVYLNAGDDLSVVLNRVEGAGGKVTTPKTLITEELGYMAFFIDTEGNLIGLHSMH